LVRLLNRNMLTLVPNERVPVTPVRSLLNTTIREVLVPLKVADPPVHGPIMRLVLIPPWRAMGTAALDKSTSLVRANELVRSRGVPLLKAIGPMPAAGATRRNDPALMMVPPEYVSAACERTSNPGPVLISAPVPAITPDCPPRFNCNAILL